MVILNTLWALSLVAAPLQDAVPKEEDYYQIVEVPVPEGLVLEIGGILVSGEDSFLVCTRRGEIWRVEGARGAEGNEGAMPSYTLFAQGLQEPLGLLAHEGSIYCTQRGELSRLQDRNEDGRCDLIEAIYDGWPLSGNYHEYCFGPRVDKEGNFWITTNKPFGGQPFGVADWRGWALRITPEGEVIPTCCGLRSPAGVEMSPDGDCFYTDNQGEWCGASKLAHLEPGDFHGHPHGIASAKKEGCPVPFPGDIPNGELMPEIEKKFPTFKLPAVWFPYDKMGKSPAGMVWDTTEGGFGPFAGQVFVTDQHHSSVMRVSLEKVGGRWQGACYPFRYGFRCGTLRAAWDTDDSMIVGMTNRGWGSRGNEAYGVARLRWTGKVPFEIHEMRAVTDGFVLEFTRPADPATLSDLAGYKMESYTYKLHSTYGSPEVDKQIPEISKASPAPDGLSVHLKVEGLRAGYVHELHSNGVRSAEGHALLHPQAYYTLARIPAGS